MSSAPIRHFDEIGDLLVRDGILVAFFAKRSLAQIASGVADVLDRWLQFIPVESLQWARVGATVEDTSPFKKGVIERARKALDPKKVEATEVTAFSLEGPEQVNPAFRFEVVGVSDIAPETPSDQTNLIEMRFPTEFVEQNLDRFSAFVTEVCELIPFDSGYCSPALNFAGEGGLRAAASIIVALALRHPGYDVHRNRRSRFVVGFKSRGARWITMLGDHPLGALGGIDAIRANLDPGVQVATLKHGVAIRAGAEPVPGDVNRNERLPLLHSVAQVIRPVTFFGDNHIRSGVFRGDTGKYERWERRFLDG